MDKTRTTLRATVTAAVLAVTLLLLAPAALAATERGQDRFGFDASDNFLCGFTLDRHVDLLGNWILKTDNTGEVRSWQGTINVNIFLSNPANDRTMTMRIVGINREVYLADGSVVFYAAGIGHWTQLPGSGTLSGFAGLEVVVEENGEIVSVDFNGMAVEGGDEALCAYLAGG